MGVANHHDMNLAVKVAFKLIYFISIEKQVLTTFTNLSLFCFLGTTTLLAHNMWANENPKVDTHSWESNWVPYGCKAGALPHDYGHHQSGVKP